MMIVIEHFKQGQSVDLCRHSVQVRSSPMLDFGTCCGPIGYNVLIVGVPLYHIKLINPNLSTP